MMRGFFTILLAVGLTACQTPRLDSVTGSTRTERCEAYWAALTTGARIAAIWGHAAPTGTGEAAGLSLALICGPPGDEWTSASSDTVEGKDDPPLMVP